MSWENIIKFERDPYFYGESYMEQVEEIGEDIKKVIEYLESIRISMPSKNSVKC